MGAGDIRSENEVDELLHDSQWKLGERIDQAQKGGGAFARRSIYVGRLVGRVEWWVGSKSPWKFLTQRLCCGAGYHSISIIVRSEG